MSEGMLLCSVAPYDIRLERLYGIHLVLQAADPTLGYSSVFITPKVDYKRIYNDLTHIDIVPIDIAPQAIVDDLMVNESLKRQGCFIGTGIKQENGKEVRFAKPEEIEDGKNTRREWLMSCVEAGDALFAEKGASGIKEIYNTSKRAAIELGVADGRGWVFQRPEAIQQCPYCGNTLPKLLSGGTVSVCGTCHAILDKEKAAMGGIGISAPVELELRKRA